MGLVWMGSEFYAFFRIFSLFFVFLRFSPLLLKDKGEQQQFTAKMQSIPVADKIFLQTMATNPPFRKLPSVRCAILNHFSLIQTGFSVGFWPPKIA